MITVNPRRLQNPIPQVKPPLGADPHLLIDPRRETHGRHYSNCVYGYFNRLNGRPKLPVMICMTCRFIQPADGSMKG